MLKADRFLADADWNIAVKAAEITDPYKTQSEKEGVSRPLRAHQKASATLGIVTNHLHLGTATVATNLK